MKTTVSTKPVVKTRESISKAVHLLDQITQTKSMKQSNLEDMLWQATEEAEYAAAILSLTHGFMDFDPRFDDQDVRKGVGKAASLARILLLDALETLESDPRFSYEKLRHAVQTLRIV